MGNQTVLSSDLEPQDADDFRTLEEDYLTEGSWRKLRALYDRYASELSDETFGYERLADHLRILAEEADDDEKTADIALELGDLLVHELDNYTAAKKAYKNAFLADKTRTTGLERARDVYRLEEKWQKVAEICDLQLRVTADEADRAFLACEKALVWGERIGDFGEAESLAEQATDLHPDEAIFDEIREIYASGTTVESTVDQLSELAEHARESGDDEMAAEQYLRAGRLEAVREGGDPAQASTWLGRALEHEPDQPEARTWLERLDLPEAGEDDASAESTAEDEEAIPPGQRETKRLDASEIQASAPDGGAQLDEAETAPEEEVATELETDGATDAEASAPADEGEGDDETEGAAPAEEGDETETVEAEDEAIEAEEAETEPTPDEEPSGEEAPAEAEADAEVEADAEEAGDTADAEAEADAEADDADGDGEITDADEADETEEAAEAETAEADEDRRDYEQLYDRAPDFEGDAMEAREVLEEDPSDLSALATLREALLETGDVDELIEQLEETVQHFRKEDEEPALMAELANLYWKELGDLEQAEYCFKQLKLLDGDHPDIFEFYRHYHRERGEWRRLFSLLNKRLDRTDDPDETRQLVERRAEIAEEEMQSPEQAINVWKRYLREHDGDREARDELKRLYEENEKWNGLIGFLESEIDRLADEEGETGETRIELLEHVADLYESELNQDVKAIGPLERIVDLQPDNRSAFERLREKLESNRRWNDLIERLSDRIDRLEEEESLERAADLAEEAGEILQDRLRRVSQAADYWRRALDLDPSREDVREQLEQLYRSRHDYEALFELKQKRLERLEGEARLEQLRDLRELAESHLRDPEHTIPILRQILEYEPDDLEVLEALENLHRKREDHESLLANLERQAELLEEDDARLDVLRRAARIHEEHTEEPDTSIERWERVLDEDASDDRARNRLTNLYLDADRYDDLEALYRERDAYRQLFDLLDSAAQTTEDESLQQDLYRRMARLAEEDLESTASVLISLESLLEVTDQPGEVARELADWYRRADELESEIEMMELVLEEADDDGERLEVLERLATLKAEQGAPEEAFHHQMESIELDPSRGEAIQRAEGFARNAASLVDFSEILETIADGVGDEAQQTALWWTIGRIEAEELERFERARDCYERIRERRPEEIDVLDALASVYEALERPGNLVEVLRQRVDVRRTRDADPHDLIETLDRIAELQHLELEQLEAARETYREILDIAPEHLPAIRGTKQLHREAERWEEAIDCLERELGLVPTGDEETRRDVQFELAELHRHQLEDYDGALHYYRQILEAHPEHEATIEAVRSVLEVPDHAREAALILEPVFRRQEAHDALAETLEAHADAAPDEYETQDVLDELVPLYREEIGDRERAFELSQSQFELDPDRVEVWDRLEELAGTLDRWSELDRLYEEYAPADATDDVSSLRYELLRHLADVRRDRLDDPEGAVEALETYYDRAPEDPEVARELEALYRTLDRPGELVEILEDRTHFVEEDDERIALHDEAARLYDAELDQPEGAIEMHREILDLAPDRAESIEALEGLLRKTERWDELATFYEMRLDRLEEPDRRRDVRLKLARVRFRHLDDYAEAETLLSTLLDERPDDEEIVEALEALDVELIKAPGARYELRERIARDLEPVYRRNDEPEELADVLEVQLRGAEDPLQRRDLLDELAELYADSLDQPEAAYQKLEAGVELDPEDADRRERFVDLGRRLDRLQAVVDTLEEASMSADFPPAAEIDKRLGELYDQQLDRPHDAIDAYRRALDYDDSDLEALRALETLYVHTEQFGELADNLRQQVTYSEPDRRPELLERVAELERDHLEHPDRAIDAYEQWLELEPEARSALDALEVLYDQQQAWPELAELLRRKAEIVEDGDVRVETLLSLAEVYEDELLRPEEAVGAYEDVLELDPANLRALDRLEALHREAGRWEAVTDVLRHRLDTEEASEPERRTEIELKLADILRTELYEVENAVDLYRTVLERDPDRDEAIEALQQLVEEPQHAELVTEDLVEVYERRDDWPSLVELYERRAEQVADPARRADFLYAIGRTYRDGLDDPVSAIEIFASAWELAPNRRDVEEDLLELVEREEAWQRLADVYRDVLPSIEDPDRRANLHMRLADLTRDRLDDALEAEQQYREVLALDARRTEAYEALEALLIDQERWLDLVELLEQKFEVVRENDEAEAVDLLLEIAEYQRSEIGDDFSAADTYERALEIDDSREPALEALSTLYRRQERWEDLAEHVERRLEMATTEETFVEFGFELAELQREHLYQPERALERYETLLEVRPTHEETIASLEAMFEQPGEFRERIAGLLEEAYRTRESWHELVDILTERTELADPEEAEIDLLEEAIEVADERADDPERALELAGRLFELAPERDASRERLRDFAARTDAWERVVDHYDTVLQHDVTPGDDARSTLLTEQAYLLESHLESLEEARRVYGEALLDEPEFPAAVDGMERVLWRLGDWESTETFYRDRAAEAEDDDTRRRWLHTLARFRERIRRDVEGALETYREILRAAPDDTEARDAVERLYRREGRWRDLVELYRRQIEEDDDDPQLGDWLLRAGRILERELDDVEGALHQYRRILAKRPDHDGAIRALERLRRDLRTRGDEHRSNRRLVLDELIEHLDDAEQWRRTVELLEEKRTLVEEIEGRAELLIREADLVEQHADDALDRTDVLPRVARAFALQPDRETYRERMVELADRQDAWSRVPPALLQPIADIDDPSHRAEILIEVGDVYRHRLDDATGATDVYQRAADLTAAPEALQALETLLPELDRWEELADVLEARLDLASEDEDVEPLLKQLGSLYDDVLERPDRAAEYYERLLERDPDELEYYDILESLYEQTGAYADLEEILSGRLERTDDPEERGRLLRRLAELQEKELDRPEAAIDTYRSLHAHVEDDRSVVDALTRLYERTERWPELLQVLGLQRDFAEGLDEVNDLDLRRGRIQMEHLDDPESAFESFRSILDRSRDAVEARRAVETIARRADDVGREASDFLQTLYRDEEEWTALEELLEQQLEVVEEPERRGEVYMELGQLYEEAFENRQMAFAMLGRGVRELPQVDYLRRELDRLSRRLDNPEELLATYEDTIDGGLDDPEVFREIHMTAARVAGGRIGNLERARTHVDAVLDEDPEDEEALELLDEIDQREQNWEDLVDVLERRIAIADPGEINDLRFRLGYLYENMLDEPAAALGQYRQVLREEPDHSGVVEAFERLVENPTFRLEICELLEPVYRRDDAYGKLVQLLQLKLEVVDDDADRADLNKQIADLQIDRLGELEIGYAHLGRALRADPHAGEVQQRLEDLAAKHGMYDRLVPLYEELLQDLADPIRVVELAERAARWAHEELEEPDRAADLYRVILDIESEHEEALDGLEEIARRQDRTEDLEEVLQRKADLLFDPDEQRDVLLELGDVRTQLEAYAQAADAYQQALLLDESDTEVMEKLVGLYEITEQYDELVDILERLTNYVDDTDEQIRLNLEIARYARHLLEEPERAIDACERVLQLDETHRDAFEMLEELYEEEQRWGRLRDIRVRFLRMAEQQEETDDVVRLALDLGELMRERHDDPAGAIDWYQTALEERPTDASIVDELRDLYREEGRWSALVDLLDDRLERAEDEQARVELMLDLAEVHIDHRDDPDASEAMLEQVRELQPDHPRVLDVRAALYRREEDWEGLLDVLDRRIETAEPPETAVSLYWQRGRLLENQLDDVDGAVASYHQLLEFQPDHGEAVDALRRLHEERGEYEELYGVLERKAEHLDDADERLELYLEMAELAEETLDRPSLAVDALERARAEHPQHLEIAEPLAEAYMEAGDYEAALPVVEDLIELLDEQGRDDDRLRFLHLRGNVYEEMGDLEGARDAYEAVHREDDTYIPNLMSLGKVCVRQEDWEEAKTHFQQIRLHQMKLETDRQKVDMYYYLGRIRRALGDDRRARERFERALSIDSDHEPSQQALDEME